MSTLLSDLRYGLRMLAKNPGFTAVAVLTLALGIGANTAIFSVMNAVILRYLPVPNPRRLVYLLGANRPSNTSQTGFSDFSFTEYTFEQLHKGRHAFSGIISFVPLGLPTVSVRYGDQPEEARVDMNSGEFFHTLGVAMARGRGFTPQDETRHAQVAVLSYDYWTRRFARNPAIVGETLYVKGVPFTVVGVAARGFTGVDPADKKPMDLWVPLQNRSGLTAWGQSQENGGGSIRPETAEIGVRMALGAERRQVLWMILRESLLVAAAGVLVGLPLAVVASRLLRTTLYGVGPGDLVTFLAALIVVAAVALAASVIPARRAASVDPMVALRNE